VASHFQSLECLSSIERVRLLAPERERERGSVCFVHSTGQLNANSHLDRLLTLASQAAGAGSPLGSLSGGCLPNKFPPAAAAANSTSAERFGSTARLSSGLRESLGQSGKQAAGARQTDRSCRANLCASGEWGANLSRAKSGRHQATLEGIKPA